MHVTRLKLAAKVLKELDQKVFGHIAFGDWVAVNGRAYASFDTWHIGQVLKVSDLLEPGVTACAGGFLGAHPAMQRLGLKTVAEGNVEPNSHLKCLLACPIYKSIDEDESNFADLVRFFRLETGNDARFLFDEPVDKVVGPNALFDIAQRIEKFIHLGYRW